MFVARLLRGMLDDGCGTYCAVVAAPSTTVDCKWTSGSTRSVACLGVGGSPERGWKGWGMPMRRLLRHAKGNP